MDTNRRKKEVSEEVRIFLQAPFLRRENGEKVALIMELVGLVFPFFSSPFLLSALFKLP